MTNIFLNQTPLSCMYLYAYTHTLCRWKVLYPLALSSAMKGKFYRAGWPYPYTPMLTDHVTFHRSTNIFCDKYDASQKTYCKRLRVLCPEHTKEPKVQNRFSISRHPFNYSGNSLYRFRSTLMMSVGVRLILTFLPKLRPLKSSVASQRSRVSTTTAGRSYVGQKSIKRN